MQKYANYKILSKLLNAERCGFGPFDKLRDCNKVEAIKRRRASNLQNDSKKNFDIQKNPLTLHSESLGTCHLSTKLNKKK